MNSRHARILVAGLLLLEVLLLLLGPRTADHHPAVREALAQGRRPDWWDDAVLGLRWAGWMNAFLLLLLLGTARLWTRPLPPPRPAAPDPIPSPRWFWPALVGAAILTVGVRLPLAAKSLWWDEAWVALQASHGKWTPDRKRPGDLKFMAHDWKRCAWYYQKPTNHAPMSLLQKASLGTWRILSGAPRAAFSDLAARVPALIASAGAVVLLGCLLRAWRRPGAGVAAAFLLALHPWHIRYGVDARAYALVVPLCVSGMFALTRILESRGARFLPWAWWGATEMLWLWAFPWGVVDVAALNLMIAILLWRRHDEARDRRTALFRLAATNLFAAIGFLQVFMPNLAQFIRYLGKEPDRHLLTPDLALTTLSQLLWGALGPAARSGPFLAFLAAVIVALLAAAVRIARGRQPGAGALPVLLGSAALFALTTAGLKTYFYPRFLIAALPVLIPTACLGLAAIRSRIPAVICAAVFLALASRPVASLLTRPIAPLRDAAEFAREDGGNSALIACYGLGREVLPLYERNCAPLQSRAELESILQRSRAEGRPLRVICGYETFNRAMLPDGFALLDDPASFQEARRFSGIEADFAFRVLRAR